MFMIANNSSMYWKNMIWICESEILPNEYVVYYIHLCGGLISFMLPHLSLSSLLICHLCLIFDNLGSHLNIKMVFPGMGFSL